MELRLMNNDEMFEELGELNKLSCTCVEYFKAFQKKIEGGDYSFLSVPENCKESDYQFSVIMFNEEILFKLYPLYSFSKIDNKIVKGISGNIGKIVVTSDNVFFQIFFTEKGVLSDNNGKALERGVYFDEDPLQITDESESKIIAAHVLLNILHLKSALNLSSKGL